MRAAKSLLLAPLVIAATSQAECDADWFCIEESRAGNGVELRAVNLTPYPLTFTLKVLSEGLRRDGPRTVTATLQPRETRPVLRLERRDAERAGRYRYDFDWTVGDMRAAHDDSRLYALPYRPGKSYRVLQGFGANFSHTGRERYAVDFSMAEGTPVHAARDGVVARTEASHSKGCWEDGCGEFANYIVILHDDGTTGEYYHLQQHGVLVEPGQRVQAGEQIGLSGNTGHTTVPHLHFAVYRAVDWGRTQSLPVRFMSANGIVSRPRRGGRYPAAAPGQIPQHAESRTTD